MVKKYAGRYSKYLRPISIILVIFILMGLFLPALKKVYNRRKNAKIN